MIPLRDENPTRSTAYVTYAIIAVNVVVFLLQLASPEVGGIDTLSARFGMVPAAVLQVPPHRETGLPPRLIMFVRTENYEPAWVTLFTAMFLHGGWLHVLGNMWFLAIFGNNIEDRLGPARFLIFYILAGLAAAAAHLFVNPASQVPTIGASGAIAGVLGAYFVLYPGARVTTLIFLGFFITTWVLPAGVVLGFWFLLQVLSQVLGGGMIQDGGGVAYAAHIGGFAAGWLLIRLMAPPERRRPRYYGPPSYWPPDAPPGRG
ncbi:MAG: rhomboid family intramembrane serine protease [Armatimonadetes bacterium]|nr:rhomboid family intramembrane serine protease [Armatimonadota bacterium]